MRQDVVFRKVRGILNKITPETFDKLTNDLINVGLDSPKTLRGVIYLLFDKALRDLKYSSLYAKLCQELSEKVPNFESNKSGPNTFCKFLISKCEDEFERRRKATEDFDNKINDLTDEEYELRAIAKQKMLGNIKFICELGKKRLLQEEILHECIRGLLSKRKERGIQDQAQDLECLCQIMRTIGSLLDIQASKNLMNQYFERIELYSEKPELPSRIRFMLKDVIDLRKNNWKLRPFQREDNAPQPLSKLRDDAGYEANLAVAGSLGKSGLTLDKFGNTKNLAGGDLSKLTKGRLSLMVDDEPSFTTTTDFHWGPSPLLPFDDPFNDFTPRTTKTQSPTLPTDSTKTTNYVHATLPSTDESRVPNKPNPSIYRPPQPQHLNQHPKNPPRLGGNNPAHERDTGNQLSVSGETFKPNRPRPSSSGRPEFYSQVPSDSHTQHFRNRDAFSRFPDMKRSTTRGPPPPRFNQSSPPRQVNVRKPFQDSPSELSHRNNFTHPGNPNHEPSIHPAYFNEGNRPPHVRGMPPHQSQFNESTRENYGPRSKPLESLKPRDHYQDHPGTKQPFVNNDIASGANYRSNTSMITHRNPSSAVNAYRPPQSVPVQPIKSRDSDRDNSPIRSRPRNNPNFKMNGFGPNVNRDVPPQNHNQGEYNRNNRQLPSFNPRFIPNNNLPYSDQHKSDLRHKDVGPRYFDNSRPSPNGNPRPVFNQQVVQNTPFRRPLLMDPINNGNPNPNTTAPTKEPTPDPKPFFLTKPTSRATNEMFSLRPSYKMSGSNAVTLTPLKQTAPVRASENKEFTKLSNDDCNSKIKSATIPNQNTNAIQDKIKDMKPGERVDVELPEQLHVDKYTSIVDSSLKKSFNWNPSQVVQKLKKLKIPKDHQAACLVSTMRLSLSLSDDDRVNFGKLLPILIPSTFEASSLLHAFKLIFDQLDTLEIETPRVKSILAGYLSKAVLDSVISFEDVSELLRGGKHHPLFLLFLQKLDKSAGQAWLNEKYVASKINLIDMLPEVDQTRDRLASVLKDRSLGYLDPMLTIEPDLWQTMKENDASPASVYRWIKDNVHTNIQASPAFAHVLISCLLKYIYESAVTNVGQADTIKLTNIPGESTRNESDSNKSTPTMSSSSQGATGEYEKELLTKYQQILQALLRDKRMQLATLYSLQTFYFKLDFPKGCLLRWFDMLYDLNIIDEDVFFTWKEEINDEYPGKGQALFQVNTWLNWLAEAESEDDDDAPQ